MLLSNKYLSEREVCNWALWSFSSWRGKWDMKLIQDYNFKPSSSSDKTNTIQFSVDVLNVGNLLKF
jgi:hypothetical protein